MQAPGDRIEEDDHQPWVARLAAALLDRGWKLATAESCTGGMIAAACTALAGSSDWFEGGAVSYSNALKSHWLGVDPEVIESQGAVSEAVAKAMAEGAIAATGAQLAVGVTGIAGPKGGSSAKPVGTVWIAWAVAGRGVVARGHRFDGDRAAVRRAALLAALAGCVEAAEKA